MLTFTPTRRTQPHADLFAPPTPPLLAMLRGRPLFAPNPADHKRQMQRLAAQLLGRGVGGI